MEEKKEPINNPNEENKELIEKEKKVDLEKEFNDLKKSFEESQKQILQLTRDRDNANRELLNLRNSESIKKESPLNLFKKLFKKGD